MTNFLEHKTDLNDPRIASVFDELSFWSARFGLLLFEHLEIRGNLKILDLACGTGFPLFELAHTYGPSCQVIGIDVWRQALARARAKLAVYQLPNVTLTEADGTQLSLPSGEFDLIVSNLGVNNFARPELAMAECFRVARPGARMVMTTNLSGHMQEFYEVYRQTLLELGKSDHLDRLAQNEEHRGTVDSICDLLQDAGFNITKVIEDRFYWRYLDGSAMFRHFLTKLGFLDGWRRVILPDEEQEIFGLLEYKLNDIARKNGELRMTIPMLYVEGKKGERFKF